MEKMKFVTDTKHVDIIANRKYQYVAKHGSI